MTPILYLHGFLSSPQSAKAQQAVDYVTQHLPDVTLIIPQIPNTISDAVPYVEALVDKEFVAKGHVLRCMGSSMGGFLSTHLVERIGGRAVLINPAVSPYKLMQDYLGEHINPYTRERFSVLDAHIEQLRTLESTQLNQPQHYKVLLQTGDEVLDYQLAVSRYSGAAITVETGGDHSFMHFERHLKASFDFLLE